MTNVALETHDLRVVYDKKPVLYGIDFALPKGNIMGILGPNGAGKSTLIKAIMGIEPTIAGWSEVFGKPVKQQLAKISYVPQRESVDWDFPIQVKDVVLMGTYKRLKFWQRPGKAERKIAIEALDKVGMLDYANQQIGALSGGQQQRVFLARALAQQSELYIMDEPFAGVDATTEQHIIGILKGLQQQNKTIVIVHHDLQSVQQYFDYLLLLNTRLIGFGPCAEIFNEDYLHKTYGGKLPLFTKIVEKTAVEEY